MATFKVYSYGKLIKAVSVPGINTIADFKKSDFFRERFGDPEYTTWYKVTKVQSRPSTNRAGSKRVNKVQALMDAFGYTRAEAKMFLKDMGE